MKSAIARASTPFVVFASVWLASPEARAAVTWRADFETGNLSQFNGNVNATKGTRQNIEFVSDPVEQGTKAGKFTVHEDDTFSTTQMRVQVTRNGSPTGEGQDVFMSWYFRLPADPLIRDNIAYWETSGSSHNMMTWWVTPKQGGGTTFDFGTGNLGSTKHIYTGDISINQWHQVASHIHWSQNAQQGHIIVWLDGAKIVDEAALTKPDTNALFFQAGIHRANRSTFVDSIFFDNFVEADSLDDLMLVAPMPDGGVVPEGGATADASEGGGAGTGGSTASGGTAGSGGTSAGAGGTGGSSATTVTTGGSTTGGAGGSGGAGGGGTSGTAGGAAGGLTTGAGGDAMQPPVEEEGGCAVAGRRRPRGEGFVALSGVLAALWLRRRRVLTEPARETAPRLSS